jgi:hypothetical protein
MEALEASRAAAFLAKGLKPLPFQKDESVARANQEANKAALSPAKERLLRGRWFPGDHLPPCPPTIPHSAPAAEWYYCACGAKGSHGRLDSRM